MFKIKKITSIILMLLIVLSMSIPSFAETSNIDTPFIHKYSVDDVKALEPYVSSVDGYFKFDVEQAKADNVEIKLIEGQVQYLDLLNDKAAQGEITIKKNLNIISNNNSIKRSFHWESCSGGRNTDVSHHWWGYARYACDCQTRKLSADLNSVASVYGGIAVVSAHFGVFPAIPPGLTGAYFGLLASRLNANNHGRGVYAEITWVLAFDITPQ